MLTIQLPKSHILPRPLRQRSVVGVLYYIHVDGSVDAVSIFAPIEQYG